jgi:hypothetical protein
MKYLVLDSFKVNTPQGEKTIQTGQVIILPEHKAAALIKAGKIRPEITEEQRDSYEERAAIMQHDGGMCQEDAKKYAWCFSVCMLTLGQRALCERVKPCPKLTNLTERER